MKSRNFSNALEAKLTLGLETKPNMHAMVLDAYGYAALIRLHDLPHGILRICHGFKIWETGEVVRKPTQGFSFPLRAPLAHPIYAQTQFGHAMYGDKAIVWTVGLQAEGPFSIPTREVLKNYHMVTTTHPSYIQEKL